MALGSGLRKLIPWLGCALAGVAVCGCFAPGAPGGANGQRDGVTSTQFDGGTGTGSDPAPACAKACLPIDCAEGMHPAPLSGECCPTQCEPDDCSLVDCPPLDCAGGTHASKPKSSCCTVCTPNAAATSGETCDQGQQGYQSYLSQLGDMLGASLCTEDGDCRLVTIDNACSQDCGTAVAARVAATFKADLDDYASTHCMACPSGGNACPDTERVAFCTGGVCSAH